MSILIAILFICSTLIIQCQSETAHSVNKGMSTCLCNLNKDLCDASCCCDADCSAEELKTYDCTDLQKKSNADSISPKFLEQTTCFKHVPIYRSNSPYNVQQLSDGVCVDDHSNTDTSSELYQQRMNELIDAGRFSRSINIDSNAAQPLGTPVNLTTYQAGISIFQFFNASNVTSYFTLPIKFFNNLACSGFQTITYMNDFYSTCQQKVTNSACQDALNAQKYLNPFCLVKNPQSLASVVTYVCGRATTGNPSSWASSSCSNYLSDLKIQIFYSNPDGISNITITVNTGSNQVENATVTQTFTVQFLNIGSTSSSTSVRSGNPGYFPKAPVLAGTYNGTAINANSFTALRSVDGESCSLDSADRLPIRFGENIQSTCQYRSTSNTEICPNINVFPNIFLPFNSNNIYVGTNGNSDPATLNSNWLPVTYCIFEIGSSSPPLCRNGSLPSSVQSTQCYTRLDIQIAYANIGSVINPQPIIGAVVFYFQYFNNAPVTIGSQSVLISQSVTFQDISNAPATQGDRIPRPNVRLPGDFFYPLTLNKTTGLMPFSVLFYVFLVLVLFLM